MSFHFFHHRFNRKEVKRIDRVALLVGVLQPLTTIPQIILIERTGNVTGISLLTWLLADLSGLVFLVYGVIHRLKPIIVTQVLWFILQTVVVIQVVAYG